MFCNKCGKEIKEDSVFCNYCGNQINTENTNKKDSPDDETYKVCPSCGKLIKWDAVICPKCGVQVEDLYPVNKSDVVYKPRLINQNLSSTPEINVRVIQDPNQNIGFGMEYALHSNKSYIGYAWLTILLYFITFWIGGFIANIVYLNAAKNTKRITKKDPPGLVFLIVLLILGIIGLVFGIIIPLAVTCSTLATAPFYTPLTY